MGKFELSEENLNILTQTCKDLMNISTTKEEKVLLLKLITDLHSYDKFTKLEDLTEHRLYCNYCPTLKEGEVCRASLFGFCKIVIEEYLNE